LNADWHQERPVRLYRVNVITSSDQHQPLTLVSEQHWARLSSPNLTSSQPTEAYYEPAHPWGKLRFWPIPTTASDVVLFTWEPITAVNLTDTLEFGPGWEEAIVYSLAVRLVTLFRRTQRDYDPNIHQIARQAVATVKRLNAPRPVMDCENFLRRRGAYNILLGYSTQ
jgi:hypothetical protein